MGRRHAVGTYNSDRLLNHNSLPQCNELFRLPLGGYKIPGLTDRDKQDWKQFITRKDVRLACEKLWVELERRHGIGMREVLEKMPTRFIRVANVSFTIEGEEMAARVADAGFYSNYGMPTKMQVKMPAIGSDIRVKVPITNLEKLQQIQADGIQRVRLLNALSEFLQWLSENTKTPGHAASTWPLSRLHLRLVGTNEPFTGRTRLEVPEIPSTFDMATLKQAHAMFTMIEKTSLENRWENVTIPDWLVPPELIHRAYEPQQPGEPARSQEDIVLDRPLKEVLWKPTPDE